IMDVKNKIALLTGASSGLGAAVAQSLVGKGAMVYGVARNKERLVRLKKRLGAKFQPVRLDITKEEDVKQWVKNTFSAQHSPDILINNAGMGSFGKVDEITSKEWLGMVNTNLNGMYFITAQVAAFMKKKEKTTHIVNIGSILGTMGRSEGAA